MRVKTTKDRSKLSESTRFELDCYELLAKSVKANRLGDYSEIVPLLRRQLKKAEKLYLNRICAEFSKLLHYYYYQVRQDLSRGKLYRQAFDHWSKRARLEEQVRADLAEITLKLNQTRNPSEELVCEMKAFCEKYMALLDLENPSISIYIFPILIAQEYNKKQYGKAAELCYKAINLYESKKINRTQHFYNLLIPALIIDRNYKQASTAIEIAISKLVPGSYSWSTCLHKKLVNQFHSEQYLEALQTYRTAQVKKQLNKAMLEEWLTVKAYFKFLIDAGVIKADISFRLGKFLNEVPIFSKDKKGANIHLIIIKMIIGIQTKSDRLIDQFDALERSYNRYTEKGSREQIFIRMLLRVPRFRFVKTIILDKCQSDIKKMSSLSPSPDTLEIIPYEKIWEIIIGRLK